MPFGGRGDHARKALHLAGAQALLDRFEVVCRAVQRHAGVAQDVRLPVRGGRAAPAIARVGHRAARQGHGRLVVAVDEADGLDLAGRPAAVVVRTLAQQVGGHVVSGLDVADDAVLQAVQAIARCHLGLGIQRDLGGAHPVIAALEDVAQHRGAQVDLVRLLGDGGLTATSGPQGSSRRRQALPTDKVQGAPASACATAGGRWVPFQPVLASPSARLMRSPANSSSPDGLAKAKRSHGRPGVSLCRRCRRWCHCCSGAGRTRQTARTRRPKNPAGLAGGKWRQKT